jgi:hypothetical protein
MIVLNILYKIMSEETRVFRLTSEDFNKSKCYAFALMTRRVGSFPNEKYYTTNPLQYLGKHIRSEEWGSRDQHSGAETFDNHGKETRIGYDYDGLTCFREVQCLDDIGMPIDVSSAGVASSLMVVPLPKPPYESWGMALRSLYGNPRRSLYGKKKNRKIVANREAPKVAAEAAELKDDGVVIADASAIPPEELCDMVFNCELMIDPVKASDGFTYERNDIEEWLQTHNTSPNHGLAMPDKRLTPDNEMRMRISEWQRQNPGYRGGKKSNRKSRKNNRKNIKKSARKNNRNL